MNNTPDPKLSAHWSSGLRVGSRVTVFSPWSNTREDIATRVTSIGRGATRNLSPFSNLFHTESGHTFHRSGRCSGPGGSLLAIREARQ